MSSSPSGRAAGTTFTVSGVAPPQSLRAGSKGVRIRPQPLALVPGNTVTDRPAKPNRAPNVPRKIVKPREQQCSNPRPANTAVLVHQRSSLLVFPHPSPPFQEESLRVCGCSAGAEGAYFPLQTTTLHRSSSPGRAFEPSS